MNIIDEKLIRPMVAFSILGSFTYFIYMEQRLEKLMKTHGRRSSLCLLDCHYLNPSESTTTTPMPMNTPTTTCNSIKNYKAHCSKCCTSSSKARRDLIFGLRKIALLYCVYTGLFFFVLLGKSSVLCLMDLEYFAEYRFLDCWILGRFGMDARFTRAARYLGLLFSIFMLIWLYLMFVWRPKLGMQGMTFLLYTYTEVLEFEARSVGRHKQPAIGINKYAVDKYNMDLQLPPAVDNNNNNTEDAQFYDSDLFYINPFISDKDVYVLRANRTTKAWYRLMDFTKGYYLMCTLLSLVVGPPFIYILGSVLVTGTGFELNYQNCVDYITLTSSSNESTNQPLSPFYSEFIYSPTKTRTQLLLERADPPAVLPYGDPKRPPIFGASLNYYELFRLSFDVLENFTCWSITGLSFIFETYLALIIVMDMVVYADELSAKLTNLIDVLRRQQHTVSFKRPTLISKIQYEPGMVAKDHHPHHHRPLDIPPPGYYGLPSQPSLMIASSGHHTSVPVDPMPHLSADILDTQAAILDYFIMIKKYNIYVTLYTLFSGALMVSFTVVCSFRLLRPNSVTSISTKEIYFLLSFGAFNFLSVAGFFSVIKLKTHRMHAHMATAMALDTSEHEQTKRRWEKLMKFFGPSPLYCFSLFRSMEISILFFLKVVSWTITAFLVATSFNQVYVASPSAPFSLTLAKPNQSQIME